MKIKSIIQPGVKLIKICADNLSSKHYKTTQDSRLIKQLKNSSQNNRCFIIGNGPSLKIADLEKLKGEDCFACNRIYNLYDKTTWRPKYYCSQDSKVLEQIKGDLQFAIENCELCFLPYKFRSMFSDEILTNEKVRLFFKPYVSVYSPDGTYPEGLMPFSDDISVGIYDGLSITYAMIQIAAYMGYKEIYLIGIDHNYNIKNGVVETAGSYAEGIKPIDMSTQFPPELLLCEVSFREARRWSEAHGVMIGNATRGGKLEVFERINLDDLV